MTELREKFRGCLLGAAIGDIAGAPVEAESPGYIASAYRSIDDILSAGSVPEVFGPPWQVGRFTDDTQMMLCIAEWLLEGPPHRPEDLLARFARACEPWRRYGPGTETILAAYLQHPSEWRELATLAFPEGSYGNGSAMRVAPVGLAYFADERQVARVAMESSRPTHSHSLAYQGAVLQAVAIGACTADSHIAPDALLRSLRRSLNYFSDLQQDVSRFGGALDAIEEGLESGRSCDEMSRVLGTGVAAFEAVPMALYCFLRHPDSYERVIHEAVFIGGDTDTIACLAGALSGARLGSPAIPAKWASAVREETYPVTAIENLADRLFDRFGTASPLC